MFVGTCLKQESNTLRGLRDNMLLERLVVAERASQIDVDWQDGQRSSHVVGTTGESRPLSAGMIPGPAQRFDGKGYRIHCLIASCLLFRSACHSHEQHLSSTHET